MQSRSAAASIESATANVGKTFVRMVDRHAWQIIAVCGVFFALGGVLRSSSTVLTTDEMLAYFTARRPSLSALFDAWVHTPLSGDIGIYPVLSFILVRLLHPIELAMRAPSIAAFFCAAVAVFTFVRHRSSTAAGLVAFAVMFVTPAVEYAYGARPYAIVLAFAAWSFVCWQRASDEGRNGLWVAGLGVSMAALMLSHYYAVLLFVPLIAGELFRTYKAKTVDRQMAMAFLFAAVVYMTILPLSRSLAVYKAHPWMGVHFTDLTNTYRMLLSGLTVVALALCGLLAAWRPGPPAGAPVVRFKDYELVAIGILLLLPFVAFAMGLIVTKTYVSRYALSFVLAFAVLFAVVISSATRERSWIAAALAGSVLTYSLVIPLPGLIRHRANARAAAIAAMPSGVFERYASLPVVVPNFDTYMTLQIYGPEFLKRRILMISDRESMLRATGTDNPSIAMDYLHTLLGFPLVQYREFVAQHPRFLMCSTYWLRDQLLKDGAAVRVLGEADEMPVYFVDVSPPPPVSVTAGAVRSLSRNRP